MLKKAFVIFTTAFLATITAQAQSSNVLLDGSVARCEEGGDAGARAYRLKVKENTATTLTLQFDALVCKKINKKMTLVPFALGEKQVYQNEGHTIVYKNSQARLAITNTEGTVLLETITLDVNKTSQDVTLNTQTLRARIFDMHLQVLEVITVDGHFSDQGLRAGGTYRIRLN